MEGLVHLLTGWLASVTAASGSNAAGTWLGLPPAFVPLAIFGLRTVDQTISTVRTLITVRGEPWMAWVLGFFQALLFITAVAGVLQNLASPLNLVAYAAGYASGQFLGITVEGKLAPGHSILRVISSGRGAAVVDSLRAGGWGVTELPGQGREGMVGLMICAVPRRQVEQAKAAVLSADEGAFVTVQNVRLLGGGWRP